MLASRTATGITLALLALPATAAAQVQPNPDNRTSSAQAEPVPAVTATAPVRPNPDNRTVTAVARDLRSPDAIDAARPGRQLPHYHPQSSVVAEDPAPSHAPDWPPIVFAVAVLLTAAGVFAGTRIRSQRSSRTSA